MKYYQHPARNLKDTMRHLTQTNLVHAFNIDAQRALMRQDLGARYLELDMGYELCRCDHNQHRSAFKLATMCAPVDKDKDKPTANDLNASSNRRVNSSMASLSSLWCNKRTKDFLSARRVMKDAVSSKMLTRSVVN